MLYIGCFLIYICVILFVIVLWLWKENTNRVRITENRQIFILLILMVIVQKYQLSTWIISKTSFYLLWASEGLYERVMNNLVLEMKYMYIALYNVNLAVSCITFLLSLLYIGLSIWFIFNSIKKKICLKSKVV